MTKTASQTKKRAVMENANRKFGSAMAKKTAKMDRTKNRAVNYF
jgi:hypothetical protein